MFTVLIASPSEILIKSLISIWLLDYKEKDFIKIWWNFTIATLHQHCMKGITCKQISVWRQQVYLANLCQYKTNTKSNSMNQGAWYTSTIIRFFSLCLSFILNKRISSQVVGPTSGGSALTWIFDESTVTVRYFTTTRSVLDSNYNDTTVWTIFYAWTLTGKMPSNLFYIFKKLKVVNKIKENRVRRFGQVWRSEKVRNCNLWRSRI